jgi:hypothetical protein
MHEYLLRKINRVLGQVIFFLSLSTLDGFYNSLIVRKNNRKVHKAENKITKSHLDKFKVAFFV